MSKFAFRSGRTLGIAAMDIAMEEAHASSSEEDAGKASSPSGKNTALRVDAKTFQPQVPVSTLLVCL